MRNMGKEHEGENLNRDTTHRCDRCNGWMRWSMSNTHMDEAVEAGACVDRVMWGCACGNVISGHDVIYALSPSPPPPPPL